MDKTGFCCALSSCNEKDDDFMVSCERCRRWWHYTCGKFDASKYDTKTPWFCGEDSCVQADDGSERSGEENLGEPGPSAGPVNVGESMDMLIEAATVAQAAVIRKDSEISALRKEMEELKVKLSRSSALVFEHPQHSRNSSTPKKLDERMEIIKKIQANHRSLVENIVHFKTNPNTKTPEKPDKSGFCHDSSVQNTDMTSLLTILNRNNIQELPSFSGVDKREWSYFEEVFKSTTIEGRFSGKENVSRLRKALKGDAYQLVSERLKYSSDAEAIMESLRVIFGRYDVLVHDLTADLLHLPVLASKCDLRLRVWAVKLNGYVADLRSMKREEDFNNSYVLTCLAGRLGTGLYQEWLKRKTALSRPNLLNFAEFLTEKVIDLPPSLVKQSTFPGEENRRSQRGLKTPSRVLTHQPTVGSVICAKCNRKHILSECSDFKAMTSGQRLAFVKSKLICFSCLESTKHDWKSCREKSTCEFGGCVGRHHPLLHDALTGCKSHLNATAEPFALTPHLHSSHVVTPNPSILFKIVPIRVYGAGSKFVDTYAFLDDGSSLSMVEMDIFDDLGLDGTPESLTLQWTKGVIRHEDSMRGTVCVSAVNGGKRHLLKNVYAIKNLELPSQSIDVSELQNAFPHLRGLPLSDMVNAKPKILVGLDQAKFLMGRGQRHGGEEGPLALKTLLGWTIYGKSSSRVEVSCMHSTARPVMQFLFHDAMKYEEDLHELVKRHFTTEEFGVKATKGDLVSREVCRAMEIMESTLKFDGERYEIGLLWKTDEVKLPDSYPMALKRLISQEKSLQKKPSLLEWKNNHVRELVKKGYARIASKEDLEKVWPRVWYTPTFIVENPNKLTPKPRDVADFAAKVGDVSLNTFLLKGPDNLVPLHAGLFKFRERAIGVNADVKEMFHRIKIRAEDQQCQRFLWRDGDRSKDPTVFIMEVMMFGPRCSPTCSQFVKNRHAESFRSECPEAVDGLTKRTYVDDYFNSHNTVEEAVSITRDAIRICKGMNFDLVGVQSNNQEFISQTPESHVNAKLVSINPDDREKFVSKVLGMYWSPISDNFTFKVSCDENLKNMQFPNVAITKREMLRTVMRIFDPLGLVSIFIIRGRIVLQEVWREGFSWDEPVSQGIRARWLEFLRVMRSIEKLQIPRRYVSWNPDESKVSLVVFVDASEKAFAAVAYVRVERNNQVEVSLSMAKAKVAPVKKLTVPRLELQAAVLGVRLAETIKNSHSICFDETIFISDSSTVLSWINTTKFKFASFVAVRIGEILESSSPRQWFYIRSSENVADDATRWDDHDVTTESSRWFQGPRFLRLQKSCWPISAGKSEISSKESETSEVSKLFLHGKTNFTSFKIFDELKARFCARWTSAVRVIALLLRFKNILRKRPVDRKPFVTPQEFGNAENWLFRKIQAESFPLDLIMLRKEGKVSSTSRLASFSPFLDEDETIRMSSRAQKAIISYSSRNPAILPKSHPLVDLLIEYYHERNFHSGTETVISDLREKVWIISIRSAVGRVKARCYMCKKRKAKPVMPVMGQLPAARLAFDSPAFTHVGVDCFGPLLVKYGRGTVKRYGMIFTCLTFRAVQVELLNDLSLDQCTMALRRFVINRVVTRYLYSDNGLNFVGSKNQLERDVKEMESALCSNAARFEGILWRFIPAYSPWMGGAWERLIQTIKNSVEFILKGVVPREDVLRNALMEAQGQINRRPLTHIPVDPEDPKPLTPNSMLFGEFDQDITAPGVFVEGDAYSRLYSRRAQHLMSQFTRRWYTEYLPVITRRSKWFKDSKPVQVGDVVILIEPNEIRSAWQLGRVTNVYPGPDNVVRTADIKMANGSTKLKRSVGRLAVLDLKSSPRSSDGPGDVIEPKISSQFVQST